FRTYMANHFEARRNIFQGLRNVFTEGPQSAPAVRAYRLIGHVHCGLAWNRCRQGFPHWLFSSRQKRFDDGGRQRRIGHDFAGLHLTRFQIFEPQFQLFDMAIQLFRARAELHSPQFGDQQFQVLDLGPAGDDELLLTADQGLQSSEIERVQIGQNILRFRHKIRTTTKGRRLAQSPDKSKKYRSIYTAICGCQVRAGCLQSMPSSSIESCARVRETEPLSACGQTNRPRSRRLAKRHKPSPSNQSTLIRSPRLPRKTKMCPVKGFWLRAVCASALSPVKPRRMSVVPAAIQIFVPVGMPTTNGTLREPSAG